MNEIQKIDSKLLRKEILNMNSMIIKNIIKFYPFQKFLKAFLSCLFLISIAWILVIIFGELEISSYYLDQETKKKGLIKFTILLFTIALISLLFFLFSANEFLKIRNKYKEYKKTAKRRKTNGILKFFIINISKMFDPDILNINERYCAFCNRKLDFFEYFLMNRIRKKRMTTEKLLFYWNNELPNKNFKGFDIFCCFCYENDIPNNILEYIKKVKKVKIIYEIFSGNYIETIPEFKIESLEMDIE